VKLNYLASTVVIVGSLAATVATIPASASASARPSCSATTGRQTLATLAAWHFVSPSRVLRETAEHSPGGRFTTATATWLNRMFSPSSTVTATHHVPAGVFLCYTGREVSGARVRNSGGAFMTGSSALNTLASANKVSSATILREDASLEPGHRYLATTAAWINSVFYGVLSAKVPAPYGVAFLFRSHA
jgi:hypothetical protein